MDGWNTSFVSFWGNQVWPIFRAFNLLLVLGRGASFGLQLETLDFRRSNFQKLGLQTTPKNMAVTATYPPFLRRGKSCGRCSNNYVYYQTNIRMTSNTRFSSMFPMGIFLLNNKRTPQFNFFRTKKISRNSMGKPWNFPPPFPKNGVGQQKIEKKNHLPGDSK